MNCPPPYCSDEDIKCGAPPQAPRPQAPHPQKPNKAKIERNIFGLSFVMIVITFIYGCYSHQ